MRLAILTMFSGLSPTYSLVNVVAEQLEMLLSNDVDTTLIVSENCSDKEKHGIFLDERIKWIKIKHSMNGKLIQLHDYAIPDKSLHESFYEEAEFFAEQFKEAMSDIDLCIMHDILYQGWNYVYNIGTRKAQKSLQHVRFLSFTHSFPVNRPLNPPNDLAGRYMPMDNTLFVYPSNSGITALAEQYNVPEGKCRVVYNTAPLLSTCCKEVLDLHFKVNLFDSEILIIYPTRLTTGKKPEKVAALAGTLKQVGEKTVKIIFCDFPANDIPSAEYKEAIRYVGDFYGLDKDDIIFTSDYGYPNGFSRNGVLDLFSLSNLFICPSFSEAFSLTVLEAASKGNFLILNEEVPALYEAGKQLGAYFMKWDARNHGYNTNQQYVPSEKSYYEKHAAEIIRLMREDRVCFGKTMIRKRFSAQWVWNNQLRPLIYE